MIDLTKLQELASAWELYIWEHYDEEGELECLFLRTAHDPDVGLYAVNLGEFGPDGFTASNHLVGFLKDFDGNDLNNFELFIQQIEQLIREF